MDNALKASEKFFLKISEGPEELGPSGILRVWREPRGGLVVMVKAGLF